MAWILPFFVAIAFCILLLVVYKVVKATVGILFEVALLYNVAFGHIGHSDDSPAKRLILFTVPFKLLTEEDLSEIYQFVSGFLNEEFSEEALYGLLSKVSYLCLFRDRVTGSIKGTLTITMQDREKNGKKFTVIKTGLGLFQRSCTGGPMFYATTILPCLWQLVKHPTRPVYLMTLSCTYMSYLVAVRNNTNTYPRYDCPKVPEFEESLMLEFGRALSDGYNPETHVTPPVITGHMKETVASVTDEHLKNPHIRFFIENNPGWNKGDGMVVCGRITWRDIFGVILKVIQRNIYPEKDRYGSQLQRSKKVFKSEEKFLKEYQPETGGHMTRRFTDLHLPEVTSPMTEEVDGFTKKRKYFAKTKSLYMGVDRIDEYSNVDFEPF